MLTRRALLPLLGVLVLGAGGGLALHLRRARSSAQARRVDPQSVEAGAQPLLDALQASLTSYRELIVLFADDADLKGPEREAAESVGRIIYHEDQTRLAQIQKDLGALVASPRATRFQVLERVLDWIEEDESLRDADRLAFRETLRALKSDLAADGTLPAVKLHKRVSEDLQALDEIESLYDKELKDIFTPLQGRGIAIHRQRWNDYVAGLKQRYSRAGILQDYGSIVPSPHAARGEFEELSGRELPPKTLVLSFDDGPHAVYTDEVAAILKQYNLPAVFFELGQNLGRVDASGKITLGRLAPVSRRLVEAGYTLGNHSFSHAQLSKESEASFASEVERTDALLKAVTPQRAPVFRFPYGARTPEELSELSQFHLQSVLWNIDSLDWEDPIPNSIADRVLREVDAEQRGILLFHDIHERTLKVLPLVLDRLVAEGYHFAAWDGTGFRVDPARYPAPSASQLAPTTGYRQSWALVVGIDDYAKWPKLQYAVRDAEAVKAMLVDRLGFDKDHVFLLRNQEATRAGILSVLDGKLSSSAVQRDDRVFVFFAGHGATRELSSGRELGYLVPADSDPAALSADAIPMTQIQDLAESIPAKHVLFVMDSCYSGLGLTRGANPLAFLKENARRVGRQMLTAGGADQEVADGGPGGHSIFTWTLLQGLGGRADLNGDGFITATELAAYLAPAVSSVSRQTPAFGSLPGSEGGEFVFELPPDTEFLTPDTPQLGQEEIALKARQDKAAPDASGKAPVKVVVKALDGGQTKLVTGKPALLPPRLAAQRANDRGLQAYRGKRYAEAEACFAEALRLRPDFALAANNLGFVYYKQGRFPEAGRWFQNAIKADPSRAVAYLNLGDALDQAGDSKEAQAAFRTYLELAPNGPGAAHARERLAQP